MQGACPAAAPEQLALAVNDADAALARLSAAGFEVERTFRCLDPRPVDPAWPEAKRLAEERFRSEIGSLALVAVAG